MSGKSEKAKRKLTLVKPGHALDEAMAKQDAIQTPATITPSTLVGTDGMPLRTMEAVEQEESTPATIFDFRAIVREHWPLLTVREQEAQARAMLARHPLIERAYRDGLRQGRDCRERWQRGMGIEPWPSLSALLPNERGFVLSRVKEAVMGARA